MYLRMFSSDEWLEDWAVLSETESEKSGREDDKLLTLALWYLLTQFAIVAGRRGT
jgi:hypothetical protein